MIETMSISALLEVRCRTDIYIFRNGMDDDLLHMFSTVMISDDEHWRHR